MLHVALWQPEIPPNTGNIARSCAATGSPLHLIGKLGFRLDDRSLRRAGIDYWDAVTVHRHDSLADFELWLLRHGRQAERIFAFSAHATKPYTTAVYQDGDCLLFGNESSGLPAETLARFGDRVLNVPMPAGKVRSLNLSTTVGIVLYHALHQLHAW